MIGLISKHFIILANQKGYQEVSSAHGVNYLCIVSKFNGQQHTFVYIFWPKYAITFLLDFEEVRRIRNCIDVQVE